MWKRRKGELKRREDIRDFNENSFRLRLGSQVAAGRVIDGIGGGGGQGSSNRRDVVAHV